jgi:hypothetical protein
MSATEHPNCTENRSGKESLHFTLLRSISVQMTKWGLRNGPREPLQV